MRSDSRAIIRKDAMSLMERYRTLNKDDATIMASTSYLIRLFDDFIENVVQIRYVEGTMYNVEVSIHEFIKARNELLLMLMDIGLGVSNVYPNIAKNFFADRVDYFTEKVKAMEMTGIVKDIYDLQAEFHLFGRLTKGGILSNQLELALTNFESVAPDMKKLYTQGLAGLGSKATTGRNVFDILVKYGRGVARTQTELAQESGVSRKTIKKGVDQILDNAGHLIRIEHRGQTDTYYVPEEFRRLHFG